MDRICWMVCMGRFFCKPGNFMGANWYIIVFNYCWPFTANKLKKDLIIFDHITKRSCISDSKVYDDTMQFMGNVNVLDR